MQEERSNSFIEFEKNADDIDRLLEIHNKEGGDKRGRRHRLEVLNKSAIVLITAFWEAYCDDVASEALREMLFESKTSKNIPKDLKKKICNIIKNHHNELEMWNLADDGWKKILLNNFDNLQESRNRKLNTPKSEQISQLFRDTIGINNICENWKWGRNDYKKNCEKLDEFIVLRGAIAHRGSNEDMQNVTKKHVTDYYDFINKIIQKTDSAVIRHVELVKLS